MIHFVICIETGSSMQLWRRCVYAEVLSTLDIIIGAMPAEAIQYRNHVLALFLARGPHSILRRTLLAGIPGDWRVPGRTVIYVSAEEAASISRTTIAKHVAASLTIVLCSRRPSKYPRSRWTGADICTDEVGIAEAVNCLLSRCFFRFAAKQGDKLPEVD